MTGEGRPNAIRVCDADNSDYDVYLLIPSGMSPGYARELVDKQIVATKQQYPAEYTYDQLIERVAGYGLLPILSTPTEEFF
jgi:hypothetical protein